MEGKKPKVSVIVPAYNAEKTLEAAVRSVLAQTMTDWELLLLDDCSRDGTWALAQRLAGEDERIRILRHDANRGVSYSRNLGVRTAEGEYVAFLDSDDLWAPDKLEKQLALAREHPEGTLYFTGSAFISADGRANRYILSVPERVDYRTLLRQNVISCSSVLARRELLLRYPMENDAIHEDYAVWLKILRREGDAFAVNEPLLTYRVSEHSKSGNKWRAAGMTFATYRYVGVPLPGILWNGLQYTVRGILKYRAIGASWEN